MADYKKLALMARAWADREGIEKIRLYQRRGDDDVLMGKLAIYTKGGGIDFSRWRAGRFPAIQQFSVLGSGKWSKSAQATSATMFAQCEVDFAFVSLCGMELKPGQVSEVAVDGSGPDLDDAGLSLIDELEKAFDDVIAASSS